MSDKMKERLFKVFEWVCLCAALFAIAYLFYDRHIVFGLVLSFITASAIVIKRYKDLLP